MSRAVEAELHVAHAQRTEIGTSTQLGGVASGGSGAVRARAIVADPAVTAGLAGCDAVVAPASATRASAPARTAWTAIGSGDEGEFGGAVAPRVGDGAASLRPVASIDAGLCTIDGAVDAESGLKAAVGDVFAKSSVAIAVGAACTISPVATLEARAPPRALRRRVTGEAPSPRPGASRRW